jgi:hypothetical protein
LANSGKDTKRISHDRAGANTHFTRCLYWRKNCLA